MWSISCNIEHLSEQGEYKIQWSMLGKRTFRHFRQASMANQWSNPHHNIIKRIMAREVWKQAGSEHWEYWAAYDLKNSIQRRKVGKPTLPAKHWKRNRSRIIWIDRLLWQECEFKKQSQWLCKSRNIWEMFKRHDRQPQSLNQHLSWCWMLS